ncbi:Phosphatidylinositol-4-phosphate 5-Kinase [Fragilaria crotonensis]|nr:Phosphatidylinositol-4-phosphate 5-Kinase [Fragilaria crotonensis]
MLFEGILVTLAYASVIVATLRAGSRAMYLVEHNTIGVMQGPLILGPHDVENRSVASPVWDLSYPFQEGVRLALFPELFQYQTDDVTIESYDMTPHPHLAKTSDGDKTDERLMLEDVSIEAKELELGELSLTNQVIAKRMNGRLRSYYTRFVSYPSSLVTTTIQQTVMPRIQTARAWMSSQRQRVIPNEWIFFKKWEIPKTLAFWQRVSSSKTANLNDDATLLDDEDDDWDYFSKRMAFLEFNGTSGENITARVSAHAPDAFADLRSWFGISESAFRTSMLESGPYISFQSNSKGAARAGGVFFFTRDGAYMIKTIKKSEAKTLLEMLPKYHKYMRHNGRKSLLTRFCGMYTIKLTFPSSSSILGITAEKEHTFVIMNSVFPAEGSQFISERYDLKGSTVGRECSEEEKAEKGSSAVLKDLDLAREVELVRSLDRPSRRATGVGFHLGPSCKAALLSQLRRDVKLLVECQVMDYSLLVGVVDMDTMRFDVSSMEAFDRSVAFESMFRRQSKRRVNKLKAAGLKLLAPIHIMSAPALYFGRRAVSLAESTLSSILTLPLPYYGAGMCGVDGGALARVEGSRSGKRAIYYIGLIDFLQPWTARKVLERQMKGLMGYDTHAISCVAPEEYASRFLEFIDSHIS